ncbi:MULTISPECIES: MFS transporter [unclassified Pseudomonas]|uniref:MFS transporter n=1 Tax=unclassified Pseudomonas TaxID=196821 RepID=UPI002AC89B31|nr:MULTISPECIES: MFS transporter [unclassified Pseudomonas]MEB0042000.1 MFS transporter [Pseudomonas sp. MH10]MEB0078173.1 MFS transporter [Pseudomonas sp. MH10out]MEB0093451.1 MFS transporter [Pseudomonas sp. CCI4.2]MEB0102227.1 MFS transporter [Pseudomonas sp. CCI3.2]MEB0121435.1 MFS transporter [Pseudomonas sp. CCI1.2]
MNENDYLIAWGVYAFAALGCLLVVFKMTGWMWRFLREPLRVLVAVLLFSPTIIDPVKEQFAPAVAMTALDLAFKVNTNIWRAVSDLAMYAMIAAGLYVIFILIRWPIEKRRRANQPKAPTEPSASLPVADEPFAPVDDDGYGRKPAALPGASSRIRVEPRL